jgi:ribosomal protein L40E
VSCPECGAKTERHPSVCRKCGATLPEKPRPNYGPGVVGASDAETRWAIGGLKTLVVVILVGIVYIVMMVAMYLHETGADAPITTDPTASTVVSSTA